MASTTSSSKPRIKENKAEFSRAGVAGRAVRNAFRIVTMRASDSKIVGRLLKLMVLVIKEDLVSDRGHRNVLDGKLEMLKGFDFNQTSPLKVVFGGSFTTSIDRVTGELTVNIPSFIPDNLVNAPVGATHFKLIAAGAEIDFANDGSISASSESPDMVLNSNPTPALNLKVNLPVNSTKPLFLGLGIEYYQHVNGKMYVLDNGAFNAMSIVDVSIRP